MSQPAVATDTVEVSRCWCCGQEYAEADLVRLGSHPEVGVCFRCARFLSRKAQEAQDRKHPSAAGRARAVLNRGRDTAIEHGWHRLPVVGPALRWLGDHLP